MTLVSTIILLVATTSPSPLLTDTETLANILSMPETAASVQIVDTRGEAAYAEGHIPGAIAFDPGALSENRDNLYNALKPVEELAEVLANAGISPMKQVIIYHEMDDPGQLKVATRLFWILDYLSYPHVSLLDGGMAKWRAEDRPIENEARERGDWNKEAIKAAITPREEVYTSREEIDALSKSSKSLLLDIRSPEEYAGDSKKSILQRGGHIPGARNLPMEGLLVNTGTEAKPVYTFQAGDALQDQLNQFQQDLAPDSEVVTYCNTGMSATAGYFGLKLGGFENVSMYEKSMSEWANDESLPIETGE